MNSPVDVAKVLRRSVPNLAELFSEKLQWLSVSDVGVAVLVCDFLVSSDGCQVGRQLIVKTLQSRMHGAMSDVSINVSIDLLCQHDILSVSGDVVRCPALDRRRDVEGAKMQNRSKGWEGRKQGGAVPAVRPKKRVAVAAENKFVIAGVRSSTKDIQIATLQCRDGLVVPVMRSWAQEQRDTYPKTFAAGELDSQILLACKWAEDNQEHRKPASGAKRFLQNWLKVHEEEIVSAPATTQKAGRIPRRSSKIFQGGASA